MAGAREQAGWRQVKRLIGFALLLRLVEPSVLAQEAAVHVSSLAPIRDQSGQFLKGMDPASEGLGHGREPGCVVQILSVGPGIMPPAADGTPHTNNTALLVTSIGRGASLGPEGRGQFGGSISPRPQGALFARVFNGPSLAQSTRYADSQTFTANGNDVFLAAIGATTNVVSGDADGDGITDVWEPTLGGNPFHRDTDGDGVSDGDEYRSGTGLADESSFLSLASMKLAAGATFDVTWDAVSGRQYRVEFTPNSLAAAPSFSTVSGTIMATSEVGRATLSATLLQGNGTFRVRLVE